MIEVVSYYLCKFLLRKAIYICYNECMTKFHDNKTRKNLLNNCIASKFSRTKITLKKFSIKCSVTLHKNRNLFPFDTYSRTYKGIYL